jgi:glycine zipper 2TM protein
MEARKMLRNKTVSRISLAALISAVVLLTGCVAAPPPRPYAPPPPPPDRPITDIYAYPQNNQTPDQQERDRFECNNWAVKQTGFDPSGPNVPPHDRYRVVAAGPAPGSGTAVGAFTGAVLGALIAGPRNAGAGLVGGAIAGGVIGTAAEQQQRAEAEQNAQNINDARDARTVAAMDARATNYRRALGACLEGRGYSVK